VSLSRDYPTKAGPRNPIPARHNVSSLTIGRGGAALDYVGSIFHGYTHTHVDALCHVWDVEGLWNGRDPEAEIQPDGVRWGGIEHWRDGIVTRGVLLDVPRYRGEPSVTVDRPVHDHELEAIAAEQGVSVGPGDALVVYSGREAYAEANPDWRGPDENDRNTPGLHASCLRFLRDHDIAVLVWDLMDAGANPYGIPWTVHGAIYAYGIALVDNALLAPLAEVCAAEGRYEFMLTVAPLPVVGGTGSPVNPIALF
jgi:kynurenine formamidase